VAKDQACKLQILSVEHPGMLQTVDTMFDKYATVLEVRRMLERKYRVVLGVTAIRGYKKNHWKARKDAVSERVTAMKSVSTLVGEEGLTAGVNALLWESLQEMSVPQLMTFKKVLNDGEKVRLVQRQFALHVKEYQQRKKQLRGGADEGTETVDPAEDYAKAQRVVAQVKEIFGIGMTSYEPPAPRRAHVPAPVPPPAGPGDGKGQVNA